MKKTAIAVIILSLAALGVMHVLDRRARPVVAGFTAPPPPPPPPAREPVPAAAAPVTLDEPKICSTDMDCVVIRYDKCCDPVIDAVNRAVAPEYRAKLENEDRRSCAPKACPHTEDTPLTARCENGGCVLK